MTAGGHPEPATHVPGWPRHAVDPSSAYETMSSVTDTPPLPGELGRGPLGRLSVLAQRLLVITAAFVLASLPAALPPLLLAPSALTTALGVLLLGVVAVALSAALVAWRDEARAAHPAPWAAFWRGWRRNAGDVLTVLAPALALLAVIAVTTTNIGLAGVGPTYAWVLVGLAALIGVLSVRAVVIASFFSFRVRDVWRLAAFTVFRRPMATVAIVALGICAVGVVWLLNEGVLLLLGGIAARALLHYESGVIDLVREEFTHEGQGSSE